MSWLGIDRRCLVALAMLLAFSANSAAQDVKWRTPRLNGDARVAAEVIPPPAYVQATPQPFRPPPLDLEPPVTRSVVVQPEALSAPSLGLPPSSLPPSTLPPEVIAPGPKPGFDPLGYYFEHADDTLPFIEEWERHTPPLISPIQPNKPGLFQKFGLSGSWIEGGTEGRAPAISELSTYTTFAVPFPIQEWPLDITTGGDIRALDGPGQPDLPPTVYDAYLDFSWNFRITQRSAQVISIAPGYYSDFEQSGGDAFRLTGKWIGTYEVVKHRITLITGSIYFSRDDLKSLYMGGLVFTPNDWSRFEAVFPTPRMSFRLRGNEWFEDWLYTGADFYGGQTYAIERADSTLDRLTIIEDRAVIGIERRRPGGAGWHVESGWVFDRSIRYRDNPADNFEPEPTYYVRLGMTL